MVQCDICDEWFHLVCVGLKSAPAEDEDWFCQSSACQLEAAHWLRRKRKREESEEESEEEEEEEEDEQSLSELLAGHDEEDWYPPGVEHRSLNEEEDAEQVEEQQKAQVSDEEIEEEQKDPVSDRQGDEQEDDWQSPEREHSPSAPPAVQVPPPPAAEDGEPTTPCIDTMRRGGHPDFYPVVMQLVVKNMPRSKDHDVVMQGKKNKMAIERPALLLSDGEQTVRATLPTFSSMVDTLCVFDVVQLISYAEGNPTATIGSFVLYFPLRIHCICTAY
jgi:hypothetical protein